MKKMVVWFLAAIMMFTMAACSNNTGNEESNSQTERTTEASDTSDVGDTLDDTSEETEDTSDFNPDNEEGVSIEDVREEFGAIPVLEGELTIGAVAKNFQNEYWRTLREGYEEAEKKAQAQGINLTVDVQGALDENDEQGQLAIVNNMINKNYDALLLSPISDGNLVPGVESAVEKNIPTLNVNDGLIANADNFVGPKADQNGELAAEWIAEKLGYKGEVAIVIGMPKAFAARQRTQGFENWMGENAPDIDIVASQNADWDRQKAKELTETWLKNYPDLAAIFCNNDGMAMGVVEAVQESGREVLVVGVDGIGEAYESIRAGGLSATIDSFPYYKSQIAVECALRSMAGQEIPRVVWTPQALIDSTNVDMDAVDIIGWTDPIYE